MKNLRSVLMVAALVVAGSGCETVPTIAPEPVNTWSLRQLCDSIGTMRTLLVDHKLNPVYESVVTEFRNRVYSEFTEREVASILDGKLFIGMTEPAMECSWGMPVDRKENQGTWGDHSEIIYGEERDNASVYTENGRVTSWRSKNG